MRSIQFIKELLSELLYAVCSEFTMAAIGVTTFFILFASGLAILYCISIVLIGYLRLIGVFA